MKTKTKRLAVCALACALTATAGAMLAFRKGAGGGMRRRKRSANGGARLSGGRGWPRALCTVLELSMEGSDGEVRAVAKNMFTFLPGVHRGAGRAVFFRGLYDGVLRARCRWRGRMYIGDLDQGKSLVARASTDGEQRFWYGAHGSTEIDTAGRAKSARRSGPGSSTRTATASNPGNSKKYIKKNGKGRLTPGGLFFI